MKRAIENIKKIPIDDIIGREIPLHKKGRNMTGLCPFHDDTKESLMVSREKGIFKCFVCGKSGDAIEFIKEYKKTTFLKSLVEISENFKIELPDIISIDDSDMVMPYSERRLYEMNEISKNFYNYLLTNNQNEEAKQFIKERKISEEDIKNNSLGLALGGGLCNFLLKKGFSEIEIIDSGLGYKNFNGELKDYFRNRIIFPLEKLDSKGKIVGFTGRSIDDDGIKYLNSKETKIFKKNDSFFGVKYFMSFVNRKNFSIIVEGPLDAIALQKCGFNNVVSCNGVNFNKRGTFVIALDNDKIGIEEKVKLAKRNDGLWFLRENNSKDMDEFLQDQGQEKVIDFVKNNIISTEQYLLEYFINEIKKTKDIKIKQKYFNEIFSHLNIEKQLILDMILENKIEINDFLERGGKNE